MDLNKTNKNLNLIFRLCVIACAVCTVIGIVSIITFAVEVDGMSFDDAFFTDRFNKFMTSMKLYMLVSWGTGLAIVLSVLAWRTTHYVSVAFRTICLIVVAVLLFSGYPIVSTIHDAGEVISTFKIEDVDDITDEMLKAEGYTRAEIEKIEKSIDNFEEDDLYGLLIGYAGAGIVYFILFFTSIVSIVKIKALYMMASDPTNSPEYYAAMAMNNQNATQGANGYGGGKDLVGGDVNNAYAPVNSNFANNGNYNGFGGAPVDNGQFNNGYGNMPMNNGFGNAPMNNGFNDPQMYNGFNNAPMNNGGMGNMGDQFDPMNQNGGYNNGNYTNQGYMDNGLPDDFDDDL